MSPIIQVDDDPSLLDLMLSDSRLAPGCYQTTNYWQFMERKLMPELRAAGLKDFRRRHRSPLHSFGASDLKVLPPHIDFLQLRLLNNRYTVRIPGYERWLERLGLAISKPLPFAGGARINTEKLAKMMVDRAVHYGAAQGALPLEMIADSLVGNPGWCIEAFDKVYTMTFLRKYMEYAYCCQHVAFNTISTLVELGSGAGRQAEVLKKLYPNLTLYLFDLPPQLYVCEQSMHKIFPGQVVGYRETRDYKTLPPPDGRIHIIGNWKFPLLKEADIDLFWNAASFQEMEPDVVAAYLSDVNASAKAAYICAVMGGKHVAQRPGKPGVLRQTVLDDYKRGLPDFELVHMDYTVTPLGDEAIRNSYNYSSSFWRRQNG